MTIEEAKILNKPIIITDTAAREAVENYQNKIIAKNTQEGIESALKKAIEEHKNIENNIKEEKYNNENILNEVIELLKGIQ